MALSQKKKKKKKWTQTAPEETQTLYLGKMKVLINGLTCAQGAKEIHGQRNKGNQENDISIIRQ